MLYTANSLQCHYNGNKIERIYLREYVCLPFVVLKGQVTEETVFQKYQEKDTDTTDTQVIILILLHQNDKAIKCLASRCNSQVKKPNWQEAKESAIYL